MNNIKGLDIGTGNVVSANLVNEDGLEVNSMRNMYSLFSPEDVSYEEIAESKLDYVEDKDSGVLAVVGEDAYKLCRIYGKDPSRPMKDGIISNQDFNSRIVMTLMLEKLLGRVDNGYITYSVPSNNCVDRPNVTSNYHEAMFNKILSSLGYKSKSLNEAMAIIYSECFNKNIDSAMAMSFGAGQCNVALCYNKLEVMNFSVCRSGDWIDEQSGNSMGVVPSRITAIKEKDFNLLEPFSKNKKEQAIKETISFYYKEMITYVLKNVRKQFDKNADGLFLQDSIPLIISGGTSMAGGFLEFFTDIFNSFEDFPYEISEIKMAKEPLSAVALGCLADSLSRSKKEGN